MSLKTDLAVLSPSEIIWDKRKKEQRLKKVLCKNSYPEVQDQTEQANISEINMMQKNTDTYPREITK